MGFFKSIGSIAGAALGGPVGFAIGSGIGGLFDGGLDNRDAERDANADERRAAAVRNEAIRRTNKIRLRIQERQNRANRISGVRDELRSVANIRTSSESSGVATGSSAASARDSVRSSFARELKLSLANSANAREITEVNNTASISSQRFLDLVPGNREKQAKRDSRNDLFNTVGEIGGKVFLDT